MTAYSPFPTSPHPLIPPPPAKPVPDQCNHILHLLITLVTFGLWAPIWLLVGAGTHSQNRKAMQEYRRKLDEYNAWCWQTYGPHAQAAPTHGPGH